MAIVEHEVWARPPGKKRQVCFSSYPLSRWQFALKLARQLEDEGYEDVEVREEVTEDDEDEEI